LKANYNGENASIKKDKWGFTLANYGRTFGCVNQDIFAFPILCEQVIYSATREARRWRVVLRKEVRGRRMLPNIAGEAEPILFQIEYVEDFEGLCLEREV